MTCAHIPTHPSSIQCHLTPNLTPPTHRDVFFGIQASIAGQKAKVASLLETWQKAQKEFEAASKKQGLHENDSNLEKRKNDMILLKLEYQTEGVRLIGSPSICLRVDSVDDCSFSIKCFLSSGTVFSGI
jgi:hypothetical protein